VGADVGETVGVATTADGLAASIDAIGAPVDAVADGTGVGPPLEHPTAAAAIDRSVSARREIFIGPSSARLPRDAGPAAEVPRPRTSDQGSTGAMALGRGRGSTIGRYDGLMRMVFEAVRLIDGVSAEARDGVDVVVDEDRIAAVVLHGVPQPQQPADAAQEPPAIIDGRGRTLLPGLIDAHAHYTFDPTEGSIATIARRSDAEIVLAAAGHAARALRAGVTTARGAGSIRNLELVLRDAIAAGRLPGPRLVAAGLAIGITGGHGHQFGIEADGEAALRMAVRRQVRDGADVIKVVASEAAMLTTTGLAPGRMVHGDAELTEAEIAAIVVEARRLDVRVMSHAQGPESVIASARGGVDSVEHAWLADRAAIEALAASGAFLVPTLVVTDVNRELSGLTPVQRERQDMIEERHRASCELAIELGVPIATGTDTGEVGVTSDMVWREIALLRDHGASPMAAIGAATSAAARLLGVDAETGSVAPGMLADLVLVEGDPLVDPGLLATPQLVMQAGRIVA
jgi:imidazolonepropionase-like amidohydrolase